MGLPSEVPPLKGIENQIDFVSGSHWPTKLAYRSNPGESEELQRQVEEPLNKGYVKKSTSMCVVPVQLVPKKGGSWRMCVDWWAIKKIILRYCHPIPRLDDMIDGFNSYSVFSKMAHLTLCHNWDDASNVTFLYDEHVVKSFENLLWCDDPISKGGTLTNVVKLFKNPVWFNDTLPQDGNIFCEDDSTFIGKGSIKMKRDAYVLTVTSSLCVPVLRVSCDPLASRVEAKVGNPLTEVYLGNTFLVYLFTYHDAHTVEWSMFWEGKGANLIKGSALDPNSWISFPFDPDSELNYGICVGMLGQNGSHNVGEIVDVFPYEEKLFLRFYHPLEGTTLCMGRDSFFLYPCFEFDLVVYASYGGKSHLPREGEAYTFLYYLFAYDESTGCIKGALHVDRDIIEVYTCLYDPAVWSFYHIDPGEMFATMIIEDVWLFLEFESPQFNVFSVNLSTNHHAMRICFLLVIYRVLQGLDSRTQLFGFEDKSFSKRGEYAIQIASRPLTHRQAWELQWIEEFFPRMEALWLVLVANKVSHALKIAWAHEGKTFDNTALWREEDQLAHRPMTWEMAPRLPNVPERAKSRNHR
ncbi:hypothetical protein KY285_009118 [Solanum tuberosum]|nr:hypothetical protein KY285_009118 [Solanum tuberosum]